MFQENQLLEFEFFLARKLGKTVAEMREQMSNDEFLAWVTFHQRESQRIELAQANK